MLNADCEIVEASVLDYTNKVVETAMASGQVNTSDEQLVKNIAGAVRRGAPQIRPFPPQGDRICLVGSGPSLESTYDELKQLYFEGAKVVTVNGSYQWCLDHNIRPSTQIVLDARPSNARFLNPAVPRCMYVLASQCAAESWDAVEGRDNVWIFHAAAGKSGPIFDYLEKFYMGNWFGVGGGVTVATRAISLLRTVGYLRFDLFGVDSCWMDGRHHAFAQAENVKDRRFDFTLDRPDGSIPSRTFSVSPWHLKQFEDFLQVLRINGDNFLLNVHGDGLIAHAIKMLATGTPETWSAHLTE